MRGLRLRTITSNVCFSKTALIVMLLLSGALSGRQGVQLLELLRRVYDVEMRGRFSSSEDHSGRHGARWGMC